MSFEYDPEDEATQRNPFPFYRHLRDEHPVFVADLAVPLPSTGRSIGTSRSGTARISASGRRSHG
jgi:hypothetical protein